MFTHVRLPQDSECLWCDGAIEAGERCYSNHDQLLFCTLEHGLKYQQRSRRPQTRTDQILALCSYEVGLFEAIAATA